MSARQETTSGSVGVYLSVIAVSLSLDKQLALTRPSQVSLRLGNAGRAYRREMQTLLPLLSQYDPSSPSKASGILTEAVGWEQDLCPLWSHWTGCAQVRMWGTLGYLYGSQGSNL